jgi:pyridoxal phosphate enzyme (YggS family)
VSGPGPRRDELAASLAAVRARIVHACAAAGRAPDAVTLIAVTKGFPLVDVEHLAALGVRDVGESREQEARAKVAAQPQLRWHYVGRLQTNKASRVGSEFGVVHSLDRAELVAPLAGAATAAREHRGEQLAVLIQVSLDADPARGGAAPALVPTIAAEAAAAGLLVSGVMGVSPRGGAARVHFARLREVGERLRADHPEATWVSAGMSGDLEDAVAEGSTHVRIGTALLGLRRPQDG